MNGPQNPTFFLSVAPAQRPGSWVYVAVNASDEILYIGVTDHPLQRLGLHTGQSLWWEECARIGYWAMPDRRTAEAIEMEWIRQYDPPYNVMGKVVHMWPAEVVA